MCSLRARSSAYFKEGRLSPQRPKQLEASLATGSTTLPWDFRTISIGAGQTMTPASRPGGRVAHVLAKRTAELKLNVGTKGSVRRARRAHGRWMSRLAPCHRQDCASA